MLSRPSLAIQFSLCIAKMRALSVTILLSGLNISGAIQPSVPIAPVWHVTEFLRCRAPAFYKVQSPKSLLFASPLALGLEIRTLWGLMSRWTEKHNTHILMGSWCQARSPTCITLWDSYNLHTYASVYFPVRKFYWVTLFWRIVEGRRKLKPCIHRKEFGVTLISLILTNVKGMQMSQPRGRLSQYSHRFETMPIKFGSSVYWKQRVVFDWFFFYFCTKTSCIQQIIRTRGSGCQSSPLLAVCQMTFYKWTWETVDVNLKWNKVHHFLHLNKNAHYPKSWWICLRTCLATVLRCNLRG